MPFRVRAFAIAMLAGALPLGASALPEPAAAPESDEERSSQELERLLVTEPASGPPALLVAQAPVPGKTLPMLEAEESLGRLREQILKLVPGETLESLARRLAERQLQVKVSSKRTMVIVELPLD